MELVIYLIFLLLSILGAINFYKKRKGWWLTLSVFNITLYSYLILNVIG